LPKKKKNHLKCSTSLTIKKIPIKISLRFYLTPVRMVKTRTQTTVAKMRGKRKTYIVLIGIQISTTTMKAIKKFFKNTLKISITLLGTDLKECKL
jgi:hypothetical protein